MAKFDNAYNKLELSNDELFQVRMALYSRRSFLAELYDGAITEVDRTNYANQLRSIEGIVNSLAYNYGR